MDWALLTLACYRLARLVAVDEGPAGIFLKARIRLGAYDYGPNGQPRTNLGRGISCPHCAGVWVALLLVLVFCPLGRRTPLYWLAVAGGQSFLQKAGGE